MYYLMRCNQWSNDLLVDVFLRLCEDQNNKKTVLRHEVIWESHVTSADTSAPTRHYTIVTAISIC